tara:strand:- start:2328 stop:2774 length:447 start_codon:yes stop_codon:yes gene_type:complete
VKRLAVLFLLAGCSTATTSAGEAHSLGWLTGCWESEDGSYREVWSSPEHGYLFGYAVSLEDNAVTFFEQTRIAPGPSAVFNAYPAGEGPSPFTERARTRASIEFANAEHDYPQVVAYRQTDQGLAARISLADGSDARDFAFVPCADLP